MRILIAVVASVTVLSAQTAPYAPKQSDRPEVLTIDEPGFQQIFDGKSLAGWEGNPTYYRITEGGNSGINYRSVVLPDAVTPDNKFAMKGYQLISTAANATTATTTKRRDGCFSQSAARCRA